MGWNDYKKFKRYLESDYPESYDADGYIIEIPTTTSGIKTWWAKIIENIYNAGKKCCLLTDYGMSDSILELGIDTSGWKTSQIPKLVELEKFLANKSVGHIIFDMLKIQKDSGKYYTPIWIQTYTDYLITAIKEAYPNIEVSLLIRQSIYDEIDKNGGRENLLALMNKYGVSIVYGCDLDDNSYPVSDEVISAPYYGEDLSKVKFMFYDFSDPWLALKNELKETEETETGETGETGEAETGTETTVTTDTTISAKLDTILAHLEKLAWLEKEE